MVVARAEQPLRIKLIDFGLAIPACRAEQGSTVQTLTYGAPEIILGLQFSEAVDMWSLGVVMAFILTGESLFEASNDYDAMHGMVELLGVPADHLLEAGKYSTSYFSKDQTGQWKLKMPEEFWLDETPPADCRHYTLRDLDELETLPLPNLTDGDADEKKECIHLLKVMLRLDEDERITPSQVLSHPFITRGTLKQSSDLISSCSESREAPPSTPISILVKSAPPECCLRLHEDLVFLHIFLRTAAGKRRHLMTTASLQFSPSLAEQ
ncbi:homeodomain-interacting protein kinase 1-like isoform X2 [Notolabrus celidotus]|uniref:homeodomain-interacting protein kinase 1-like isoform X2 n=1 Tax=Notolabrus celidotus TaxID=1203425 RepID=UPI00148FB8E6|nr:homeodomain-interacting protein kinase 1-like isoform X2 [Notolabrus celidotus]